MNGQPRLRLCRDRQWAGQFDMCFLIMELLKLYLDSLLGWPRGCLGSFPRPQVQNLYYSANNAFLASANSASFSLVTFG